MPSVNVVNGKQFVVVDIGPVSCRLLVEEGDVRHFRASPAAE